jgi:hypothetical protein
MGILHWSRMTGTYYWKIFGCTEFDRAANERYLIRKEDDYKIE